MAFVRLIAIAKDEAAYLAEWVHHHLHFGFDQIAVILNGCTDNSQALLERIAQREPRLLVRDGDDLKAVCQVSGQSFQIAAYAQELALARQDSRVTHVMCLDVDEFWVTLGLQDTIHTFTDRYPQADSIAFSWHMEVPNNPEPFSPALQSEYPVQKNRHVKSLNKVTDRLIELEIHNAEHASGSYLLADGSVFQNSIANGASRAVLELVQFQDRINCLDPAFVYHRLFRSQIEYLASLQRGRPNLQVQLKDNRWGYRTDAPKTPVLTVSHPPELIQQLRVGYTSFADDCNLDEVINVSRQQTMDRANDSRLAYQNPSAEVKKLTFLFAGLSDLDEPSDSFVANITHKVDSISTSEHGFVVKGWVIDKNSQRAVSVVLPDDPKAVVTRLPRPDLLRHYPGAHANGGFHIELKPMAEASLNLSFQCGSTTESITLALTN